MNKSFPSARLGVIGGGPNEFREELARKISDEGLTDKIELLGYQPGNQAFRLLKAAPIFLFPSHEEGFGMAIAEAMACSCAVVAYDLPVYRECFKNTLLTAPLHDLDGISNLVITLLSHPNLLTDRIKKGIEISKSLDWSLTTKREWSIIQSIPSST